MSTVWYKRPSMEVEPVLNDEANTEQLSEDQIILAFRYYTHGIITTNYFLQSEEYKEDNLADEKVSKEIESE